MIGDLAVTPLRRLGDERGGIMHMLRADWPAFRGFGEVYFSTVFQGRIKGWNRHHRATLNLTVPHGAIALAVFDGRPDSLSQGAVEILRLSPDDHRLVTVPPGLWFSFQGLAEGESLLASLSDLPHDPHEVEHVALGNATIPFDWDSQP